MDRSWSVILASALTTTTGRSGRRSRTMAATRSMACASCTEVPPNFMTIMEALQRTPTTETRRHGERQGDVYLLTEPFCFLQRDKCQGTTSVVPHVAEEVWPLGPEVFCNRG